MKTLVWTALLALSMTACADGTTDTDTASTGDTGETTPDTTPPTVAITVPADKKPEFYYDGYDDKAELWYVDVALEGTATDPEDGPLSGVSLAWSTSLTSVQGAALGSGSPITARLYSDDCFGVTHTITLTATDSAGNTATDSIDIFIWTLC